MSPSPNASDSVDPSIILVLSAPSGAGKTTLAQRLLAARPGATLSVSFTTRPPRGQERDGIDYHFVSAATFHGMIDAGDFVEWAEVHGHFYGSSRTYIEQVRSTHGLVIFDIDVQGGQSLKAKYPGAVLVFVLPPSMAELERRLRGRGTDRQEVIHRRLIAARGEIERGTATYDYLVINDDLDRASAVLQAIVTAEQVRRGRVNISPQKLHAIETTKESTAEREAATGC